MNERSGATRAVATRLPVAVNVIATAWPRAAAGATPLMRTRLPSRYTSVSWSRPCAHTDAGETGSTGAGAPGAGVELGPGAGGVSLGDPPPMGATVTVTVPVPVPPCPSLPDTVNASVPSKPADGV